MSRQSYYEQQIYFCITGYPGYYFTNDEVIQYLEYKGKPIEAKLLVEKMISKKIKGQLITPEGKIVE